MHQLSASANSHRLVQYHGPARLKHYSITERRTSHIGVAMSSRIKITLLVLILQTVYPGRILISIMLPGLHHLYQVIKGTILNLRGAIPWRGS